MRKINAQYDHRFSIDFIRQFYSSPEAAFLAGDYILAAEWAEENSELQACALILAGFPEKGLQSFAANQPQSVQALLCKAFAFWYLDQEAEALETLNQVFKLEPDNKIASDLFKLISKDQLTVFQIAVPPNYRGLLDNETYSATETYGKFVVKNVGTQLTINAYDYTIDEPFDEFIESLPDIERPDMILSLTSYWFLPKNYEQVAIPKVIWHHTDSDKCIHRAFNNFYAHDISIVWASQEHFELSRTFAGSCVSHLSDAPWASSFTEPRYQADKTIDVCFTGACFGKIHSEKPRFLFQLSKLADKYQMLFLEASFSESQEKYHTRISYSKMLPIINRYCGAASPRWRDALNNSVFLLYPQGTLYGKVAQGCLPFEYSSISSDIDNYLKRINNNEPGYSFEQIYEGATREFTLYREPRAKRLERFLKFALFVAIFPKKIVPCKPTLKPKFVWMAPTFDMTHFGIRNIIEKVASLIEQTCFLHDDNDYNNLALNYYYLYHFSQWYNQKEEFTFSGRTAPLTDFIEGWKHKYQQVFLDGIKRFPQSLILKYNYVVSRFVDSNGKDRDAFSCIRSLLEEFDNLQFNPFGTDIGLYWRDDIDKVFPYFQYGQEVVKHAVWHHNSSQLVSSQGLVDPKTILLSCLHGYLGWGCIEQGEYDDAVDYLNSALDIFPNNQVLLETRFRLYLLLINRGIDERKQYGTDLIESFFDYANTYPVVLLTDCHIVASVMQENGRIEELKELLADWYRFGGCCHYREIGVPICEDPSLYFALLELSEFFPSGLKVKIEQWIKKIAVDPIPPKNLTPIENGLYFALLFRNKQIALDIRMCFKLWISKKAQKLLNQVATYSQGKKLAIFGGGNYGRELIGLLQSSKEFAGLPSIKPSIIIDNDSSKWGTISLGLPINGPLSLNDEYYILIASMWKNEIAEQLNQMGFKPTDNFIVADLL